MIRVRYRGEKKPADTIEVQRHADLASKLDEIKGRTEAVSMSVYRCERRVELVQSWNETPYTEPKEDTSA